MAVDSLIGQVDRLILSPGGAGDQMKFAAAAEAPDVFLGVDDDLIYPPDYVETTLRWLADYPDAIVSYHGWVAGNGGEHAENFRCMEAVNSLVGVDVVGTGVCAFRVEAFRPRPEFFKHPNQADLWLAIAAQERGVPRYVLPHRERWFGYTEWPHTIWHDTAHNVPGADALNAGESKRAALQELLPLLGLSLEQD
ncbi:MAG TPA: hypothetical protein VFH56_13865 [Acidimicrobiales bacterium]|nr:hypothetical protein [Acidimicrobiales bacterium]